MSYVPVAEAALLDAEPDVLVAGRDPASCVALPVRSMHIHELQAVLFQRKVNDRETIRMRSSRRTNVSRRRCTHLDIAMVTITLQREELLIT